MLRTNVSSSNIRSIGFENGTLEVQFTSGEIYQYFNVPESVHRGLMLAASHGQYFDSNIKKAGYSYRKI